MDKYNHYTIWCMVLGMGLIGWIFQNLIIIWMALPLWAFGLTTNIIEHYKGAVSPGD